MPVPFTNLMTSAKQTASLISALADAGATYTVAPNIGVRGDLGVGALVFSGIGDRGQSVHEQRRIDDRRARHVRGARGGVGRLRDHAEPARHGRRRSRSSTARAKSGLRDDIKSILSLDFMLGLGYRM